MKKKICKIVLTNKEGTLEVKLFRVSRNGVVSINVNQRLADALVIVLNTIENEGFELV